MATIKAGTYRFNDVLIGFDSQAEELFDFTVTTMSLGFDIPITVVCNRIRHSNSKYKEVDYTIVSSSVDLSEYGFDLPATVNIYANGDWATEGYGEGIKTITVPYDQDVSDEYAVWHNANTKKVSATVSYNGSTIANLFGGQTATLKCEGMKMETDLVVEVAEQTGGDGGNGNIVPLVVGDIGTYDENGPVIVTETFTGGGEPDAVFDYFGYSLPFFKAKKLVATRDICSLVNTESLADKLHVNLFGEVIPLWQMEYRFGGEYCLIMSNGFPAIIWILDSGSEFTQEAGFEVGGVYVIDAWSLMETTGEISLTALGVPVKPADGYMPVQVVLPIEDELVVNIQDYHNYTATINNGILYRKVKTIGMTPKNLTITPTRERQIFQPENNTFYHQITVEPIDLSDLSKQKIPCGIYLDPMPKTEYKVGEFLDTDGSRIVQMYTNGEKERVTLISTDVHGWDATNRGNTPGKYILTVKYSVNGINMQTTYQITITES